MQNNASVFPLLCLYKPKFISYGPHGSIEVTETSIRYITYQTILCIPFVSLIRARNMSIEFTSMVVFCGTCACGVGRPTILISFYPTCACHIYFNNNDTNPKHFLMITLFRRKICYIYMKLHVCVIMMILL